ncbi:MAG TPA: ParB/RepB/Spo0J family partition protein [Alphaproteobacteria bacterium]|nr:ParB/RepB/Spo0J family partition protein [Alphaproteobacteria bacterium]
MNAEETNIKRRGLGRGLNALFGDDEIDMDTPISINDGAEKGETSTNEQGSGPNRRLISIGQIIPGIYQPRHIFKDESLAELAGSIRQHGLIQPILVRPHPQQSGAFEIVAGERRWRAAQLAQLHEVPVIIRELDDTTTLEIALIENLQREDLNALDEARALRQLADQFEYTHEQVAEKVGKSRSYVANMLRLNDLAPAVQSMVSDGKLSAGHARTLLILDHDQQEEQAKKIVALGLSVRQTEKMIADLSGRDIKKRTTKLGKKIAAQNDDKDLNTIALEKEVSNVLGMTVSIDMTSAQEGVMSIQFKSLDQLDEVLHRLSHNPGRLAIRG